MAYKKSGYSKKFYESNRADIALHEAAKKHFDNLGISKLPKISELKQEYATLQTDKKKLYSGYRDLKKNAHDLLIAKSNAERILDIEPTQKITKLTPEIERENAPEI
jgi:predicted restriction endonuclease